MYFFLSPLPLSPPSHSLQAWFLQSLFRQPEVFQVSSTQLHAPGGIRALLLWEKLFPSWGRPCIHGLHKYVLYLPHLDLDLCLFFLLQVPF